MSFAVFLGLAGLCCVWWRADWRDVVGRVFAVLVGGYWLGEFFAAAVPGTDPSPEIDPPNTVAILGADVYGNLFFSGALAVLAAVAFVLSWASRPRWRAPRPRRAPDRDVAPRSNVGDVVQRPDR